MLVADSASAADYFQPTIGEKLRSRASRVALPSSDRKAKLSIEIVSYRPAPIAQLTDTSNRSLARPAQKEPLSPPLGVAIPRVRAHLSLARAAPSRVPRRSTAPARVQLQQTASILWCSRTLLPPLPQPAACSAMSKVVQSGSSLGRSGIAGSSMKPRVGTRELTKVLLLLRQLQAAVVAPSTAASRFPSLSALEADPLRRRLGLASTSLSSGQVSDVL